MSLILSVCLSVCEQDYCKSNQPISLKLGVMIGQGDPVPDRDCGSVFRFRHYCGIGITVDLLALYMVAGRLSLGEMTDAHKVMNPQHFGSGPDRNPDQSGNLYSNPGSLLVVGSRLGGGLRSLNTV